MTKKRAKFLAQSLEKKFGGHAEFEALERAGQYRFAIASTRFKRMGVLKRQDKVWEVVNKILSRDESLDVSMILTFAPSELTT